MHSLYHALLAQHPKQLIPVRCSDSTTEQLQGYLEDVVLENELAALIVECLPTADQRSVQETARLKELDSMAQSCFLLLTSADGFRKSLTSQGSKNCNAVVLERRDQGISQERFVVIADDRFSALLAAVPVETNGETGTENLVVWTFEPDVVFSGLQYLMARVSAEYPSHGHVFAKTVNASTPKATSLQLTLGVTTKLTRLLHGQSEREIAVNRIANENGDGSKLEDVLQVAVNAVGRALSVQCCAVRIQDELVGSELHASYFGPGLEPETAGAVYLTGVDELAAKLTKAPATRLVDANHPEANCPFAQAVVPLMYRTGFVGLFLVRANDPSRIWTSGELMFLQTVAAQLIAAGNQAHLSAQLKEQALTDALTGCYNRRAFELQLERDLHLATRMRQPVSLIMLDLDHFKHINDRAGHDAGDNALRILADALRAELRAVDTAVRFGGDEFAVILPQANMEGAIIVAERLRSRLEQTEVPGYGRMTASFGLATFPVHASSRDALVVAADRALYRSKHSGRNRVSVPVDEAPPGTLVSEVSEEIVINLCVS